MILLYLGLAWLLGIYAASLFSPPLWLLAIWILFGILVAGWGRKNALLLYGGLMVAFFLLGWTRYQTAIPQINESTLAYYNDREVAWEGVVAAEPIVRERYVDLRVEARRLRVSEEWKQVSGLALVRSSRFAEYEYGNLLLIEGELEMPPEDFSWRDYLARQGIQSLTRYPEITLLAQDQGNPVYHFLFDIKAEAHSTIQKIFPEPEASLLSAILLGLDSGLPRDLALAFNRTNTRHIVAISGFNISILAGILLVLGEGLLGKRRRVYFALAGIAIYTVLVGASPSVVRAAIMGSLYIIALSLGRQSHALISLAVAASLMALANPLILWDIGFQLSFASTMGLILHAQQLQSWWERVWATRFLSGPLLYVGQMLGDAVLITFVAQAWAYPILIVNFHEVSLVSLIANTLIVPAQWGVMVLGGLATLLGLVFLPLGQVAGWFAWAFLAWTVRVAEALAQFPVATISVEGFDIVLAAIWYAALFLLSAFRPIPGVVTTPLPLRFRPNRATVFGATLALANILVFVAIQQIPDGRWHMYFLDVGQGDSILIQTPRGQRILVDGGPTYSAATFHLGRILPFWDRRVDLLVLSHPQADHITGLISVLERYQVGQVLYSEPALDCGTLVCERFFEILEERGIPHHEAEAGMWIQSAEGAILAVLHPPIDPLPGREGYANNNSLVLHLDLGQVSVLLTGDLETVGEMSLLSRGQEVASLVLKVPHHGSATSTTSAFLRAVSPYLAVISVGEDNPFGHPREEVLDRLRGKIVLRTDEQGTIELITDGERLWLVLRGD